MNSPPTDALEHVCRTLAVKRRGDPGDIKTCDVWAIPYATELFDIVAQLEIAEFPDAEIDLPTNAFASTYLVVASTSGDLVSVHHMARVCEFDMRFGPTGVGFIEETGRSGQGVTADDLAAALRRHGVDLHRSVSVECNVGFGAAFRRETRTPYSLYAYSAIFRYVADLSVVMAWLNRSATRSLERVGLVIRDLGGRELYAPRPNGVPALDERYRAGTIYIAENAEALRLFDRHALPIRLIARDTCGGGATVP